MKMLKPSDIPPCTIVISDRQTSVFPLVFYNYGLSEKLHDYLGFDFDCVVCEFKNGDLNWAVDLQEWRKCGRMAFEKIRQDPAFFEFVCSEVVKACGEMVGAAEKSFAADYSRLSNDELLSLYRGFAEGMKHLTSAGLVFSFIDTRNGLMTAELHSILSKRLPPEKISEAFSILTTPTEESFLKKEKTSLLKLGVSAAKEIPGFAALSADGLLKQIHLHPSISKAFQNHFESFFWLPYNYEGPAFSETDFAAALLEHAKSGKSFEAQLKALGEEDEAIGKAQAQLAGEMQFSGFEKYLFDCARRIILLKGYRKDAAFKAYCLMEKWLYETGARFGLSVKEMRLLTPDETKRMLSQNAVPAGLAERYSYYVFVTKRGVHELFQGKEAKPFSERIIPDAVPQYEREIKGSCACPGLAQGPARIINSVEDLVKMRKGDILVSIQTNPNLLPALGKASAIVTDIGGITSHAAIISRELQIPCVIGTNVATKWLKDGDLVEVDATNGVVKKLGS